VFARILLPAGVILGVWVFLSSPGSRAATAVVTQACSPSAPGAATVTLAWPATKEGARESWLDLSLSDGFAAGTFQSYGPLAATQTAYAVDGVPQGLTYHYRVNTLYADNWRVTAAGSFLSRCK
jgi:hypothetical protein